VIPYASRTGTKRNLKALREANWRLLISATGVHRSEGFPYAIDNGAWTAFQQNAPFDEAAFMKVVESHGGDADWVILPDIVAGGSDSLRFSMKWMDWTLQRTTRVLIAVQDGMVLDDVRSVLCDRVGLAIGGSTEWKERCLGRGTFSGTGSYLHALRVNSKRRIRLCQDAGCDSMDGSSASRFAKSLPRLDSAIKQGCFKW